MSAHGTVADRAARGKAARQEAPRTSPAEWTPSTDRADPVALLEAQNATREPDLVPVRHGRMAVSAFTFYRGAAKIMAEDLAALPRSGFNVQLCGDAHLSNFGLFASPERTLVFDCNDFDETLPGPFEFDVYRLAASFVIASRNNGLDDDRAAAHMAARSYREAMRQFSTMDTLDVWYAHLSVDDVMNAIKQSRAPDSRRMAKATEKNIVRKARTRTSLSALSKLGELVDGEYRIVSQPPLVVPARDLEAAGMASVEDTMKMVHDEFVAYRTTLDPDRRFLTERFDILDAARKVVGVGSVGTRAFIVLLQGRDSQDPLFLQVKEANRSVFEGHLPASQYAHSGERVVQGQRMMQAASDIFLGWTEGVDTTRHFYWRQLRDMKGSIDVENLVIEGLLVYARMCGLTLARAHARSGDAVAIASYLGKTDTWDRAIGEFASRYADQNERDYQAMLAAVSSGRLTATPGL